MLTYIGDVSFSKVSRAFLAKYLEMAAEEIRAFFNVLAQDFGFDARRLAGLVADYTQSRKARANRLRRPRRQEGLRRLNRISRATANRVAMRSELKPELVNTVVFIRSRTD